MKKLTEKDLQSDFKSLKEVDIEMVQDSLDGFALNRQGSWGIEGLDQLKYPLALR